MSGSIRSSARAHAFALTFGTAALAGCGVISLLRGRVSAWPVAIACAALATAAGAWVDRLRVRASLRELVLESSADGWLVLDRTGHCLSANERAATLLGSSVAMLIGTPLAARLAAAADPSVRAATERAILARTSEQSPVALSLNGSTHELRTIRTDQAVVLWIRGAASSAARAPSTHDLVQPLGAIVNYAELSKRLLPAAGQDYANQIVRIANQMADRMRHPPAADGASAESRPAESHPPAPR